MPLALVAPFRLLQIDDAGAVEATRQKRQDDIRARLAAGAAGGGGGGSAVAQDASVAVQQQAADYYTQEEMAKVRGGVAGSGVGRSDERVWHRMVGLTPEAGNNARSR